MPALNPTTKEAVSRLPDTRKRAKGVIHEGDCLKVMRGMKAESIRLIVTSPPYNLKNSTGNGMKDGRGGKWPKAALIEGGLYRKVPKRSLVVIGAVC